VYVLTYLRYFSHGFGKRLVAFSKSFADFTLCIFDKLLETVVLNLTHFSNITSVAIVNGPFVWNGFI
jgi:hypothetical protein